MWNAINATTALPLGLVSSIWFKLQLFLNINDVKKCLKTLMGKFERTPFWQADRRGKFPEWNVNKPPSLHSGTGFDNQTNTHQIFMQLRMDPSGLLIINLFLLKLEARIAWWWCGRTTLLAWGFNLFHLNARIAGDTKLPEVLAFFSTETILLGELFCFREYQLAKFIVN